jgi:hypothetical protein
MVLVGAMALPQNPKTPKPLLLHLHRELLLFKMYMKKPNREDKVTRWKRVSNISSSNVNRLALVNKHLKVGHQIIIPPNISNLKRTRDNSSNNNSKIHRIISHCIVSVYKIQNRKHHQSNQFSV